MHAYRDADADVDVGFNGAAAKSSGKFVAASTGRSLRTSASMGPPLKAAENAGHCSGGDIQLLASMGPPLKAAENRAPGRGTALGRARLQWGRR